LKHVLYNLLGRYANIKTDFVGGTPRAILFDENDQIISKVDLIDYDLSELKAALGEHGFVFKFPKMPKPSGPPDDQISLGGCFYELYLAPNDFFTAKEFAESLSKEGFGQGRLPAINSQTQHSLIQNFLRDKNVEHVWLGASDLETEGEWKWLAGPLANQQFWRGDHLGSVVPGSFQNWRTGEPNNADNEDCAVISSNVPDDTGAWNDALCEGVYHPILVEFGANEFTYHTMDGVEGIKDSVDAKRDGGEPNGEL